VLDELELEAAMGDPLHGREVSVDGLSAFVVESSGLPSGVATPGRGDELTGRPPDA
jgi:hypothetical protein